MTLTLIVNMIKFKELHSDDEYIQKELDMLKELNPIFVRIEELDDSTGMPETPEAFESKRVNKL
jgi:hypothetical protein